MGIISNLRDKYLVQPVVKRLTEKIDFENISKADNSVAIIPQQFEQNYQTNSAYFNKRKPGLEVTYTQLRNLSELHDITRACINIRKREITQLDWSVVTVDKNNEPDLEKSNLYKSFLETIGGPNVKMRKLLDMMVEDFLVIDGVPQYKRKTRAGQFLGLIPVDPTTIKILVDENGRQPLPPNPAYQQWINGTKVEEFTSDQMIYEMLNPRTNTPYGFSVVEALLLTIQSSLRSDIYTASFFTDGSVPEGFFGVPKEWSDTQIQQYQAHFDSLIAGDARMQHRIKFVPSGGDGFKPTKNFDFNGMAPYYEWLMRKTASLFGVMPQELGFTDTVNKANGQEQTEISKRNAIKPLAQAIEDIFTHLIQTEEFAITDSTGKVVKTIGPSPELKFSFLDIDAKDEKMDTDIAATQIKTGMISIDEWRKERGLEPYGIDAFVLTASGPQLIKDIISGANTQPTSETPSTGEKTPKDNKPTQADNSNTQNAIETNPLEQLDKWERKALADVKEGRAFRKFETELLDEFTKVGITHDLTACTDKQDVKKVFEAWRAVVKAGINNEATRLLNRLTVSD